MFSARKRTAARRPTLFGTPETTQNGATGASLVITKPTGVVSGHYMIALNCQAISSTSGDTWTGDTSWNERIDTGSRCSLRIADKTAGGSEGASYTFTASSSSEVNAGAILAFSNAQFDAIGTASNATAGGSVTPGAVTSSSSRGLLLFFIACDAASIGFSTPTGMTLLASNTDATSPSWAVFYEYVAAGSTGTSRSSDPDGASGGVNAVMVVLKPT